MSARREDESEPEAGQTGTPRSPDTEGLEIEGSLLMTPTPDQASDYVPPRTLPSITNHKTIETAPVKVDPELDPSRARTMLSLRRAAQQEGEAEAPKRRNPTRTQLPWILISLLVLLIALIYWLKAAGEGTMPPPVVPQEPKIGRADTDSAGELKPQATGNENPDEKQALAAVSATARAPVVASATPKKRIMESPKSKTLREKKPLESSAPSSTAPTRELWLE